MGIVKIDDQMHEELRQASKAMSRSINAQAEHWLRMGRLAELYPEKTCHELTRLLLAEHSPTVRALLHELDTH